MGDAIPVADVIYEQHKVLYQWFPQLVGWMNEVPDPRKFHRYSVGNLLMEGLFLFLTGEASRNAANNRAAHGSYYQDNFRRLAEDLEWAHLDTVDDLLRMIQWTEVEEVKNKMIRRLIEKKRIASFYGRYLVAIDATGVSSYDQDSGGTLLYRQTGSGHKTYLNIMLEAKLITPEGLAISLASEPLTNSEAAAYQKQDCELKAFKRLADKIKKNFPRLPVCLLLDGLYPNGPVFDICENKGWKYIAVLKDGSLKLLQEQIRDTEEAERLRFERPVVMRREGQTVYGNTRYQCIEGLQHDGHPLIWIACMEPPYYEQRHGQRQEEKHFIYVTNLALHQEKREKPGMIIKIVQAGRLRWKIENEGFNSQKNQGYHLHHKFSRHSVATLQVYYMLLQIAHLINQLVQHSRPVVALLKCFPKLTYRYLWDKLRHGLEERLLNDERLRQNKARCQIRLE